MGLHLVFLVESCPIFMTYSCSWEISREIQDTERCEREDRLQVESADVHEGSVK